jgi:arginyl-tRNA synthetase
MILGQDHHSYVVRLKGLAQAMGYNPDRLEIILYQLVTLKASGNVLRMSKRAGNMVTLTDVLDTVGTDVARFFYLNRKVDAHLDFDVDLALKKNDENPVYYLQYAYVRTRSIATKALEIPGLEQPADLALLSAGEIGLLKKIIALKDILAAIGHRHQTHLLTYYLQELAHTFHHYYTFHRVIDPENIPVSRVRLATINLVGQTLGLGLALLGISRPEKM